MARHSLARNAAGLQLAANLHSLLQIVPVAKLNRGEKVARAKVGVAPTYFGSEESDITESARRELYAIGFLMSLLPQTNPGKYSKAFAAYGEALTLYADANAFPQSVTASLKALELARAV